MAVDAIDFTSDMLHVVQQLKLSRSKAVFAPPKGGKLRDVPLATLLGSRSPLRDSRYGFSFTVPNYASRFRLDDYAFRISFHIS